MRGRILLAVLGVVVAAAAVIGGVNGYRYWDDRQAEHARKDAVATASRTVEAMFTYSPQTVDTDLRKSADNLTGDFREDYLTLIDKQIAPGAKEKQLTVTATTQAGGVVSADRSHAVVLLFLNQVMTSKDTPQGTTTGSRVRVSLAKTDSRWLVEAVTPV
ncbi:h domain protein [Nocardia amamiensis]|uniref:H domain protein n=1 Tax=Nocardia amamiensis TaxID=404578 RepID=A0ABS0CVM0_9NOCA|nr:h domain protein [Nocardia amamiensis]